MAGREPELLRLGKEFEKRMFEEYPEIATDVSIECRVHARRGSGRAYWDPGGVKREPPGAKLGRWGFIDVVVTGHSGPEAPPFKVVVELKNTDWGRVALRRNANAHRLQLWTYLEPSLEEVDAGSLGSVQGYLVYPTRPDSAREDALLEILSAWGISVEWLDEVFPTPSGPQSDV